MADNVVLTGLESGVKKYWRPVAAYVYLAICLFDFVAAPVFIEMRNSRVNVEAFMEIRQLGDKELMMKALDKVDLGRDTWKPLTLEGGGLFHLSFGAILGVAAWTRGQEKKTALVNGNGDAGAAGAKGDIK